MHRVGAPAEIHALGDVGLISIATDRCYTRTHLWLRRVEDACFEIGVTDYVQRALGSRVCLVEILCIDQRVETRQVFGRLYDDYYRLIATGEYACRSFDLVAPFHGRLLQVNPRVMDDPELINRDPYGQGWLVVFEAEDPTIVDRANRPPFLGCLEYERLIGSIKKSPFRVL